MVVPPDAREADRMNAPPQRPGYGGYGRYGEAPDAVPEESPFLQTWRTVMLRKWAILGLALLVALIAAVVAWQQPSYYTAAATVLVEVSKPRLTGFDDAYGGTNPNREFLQTQAEVMKSRDVAARVVRKLQLTEQRGFDARQDVRPPWQHWVIERLPAAERWLPDAPSTDLDAVALENTAVTRVLRGVSTEIVRGSQLIRVRYTGENPAFTANVANAVVQSYVELEREKKDAITEGTSEWIDQRARELKVKLDASERALQTFRERESLLATKSGGELGGASRDLTEFGQRLVDARVRSAIAREAVDELKRDAGNKYLNSPQILKSESVQAARQAEASAQKNVTAISQRYGPDHPRYAGAMTELADAKTAVDREVKLVVDGVLKEYTAARALEKTLEDAQAKARGSVQTQSRKEVQLGVLERDAATARQLYEGFLSRFKQPAVSADAQTPGPRVIDAAVRPNIPAGPDRNRSVMLAFFAALAAGVFGALGLSRLDNTIKTSLDVEGKLQQPFLTALPQLRWGEARMVSRAAVDDPHGMFAEAIRTAATGIMLSAIDSPHKIVTVTSSLPDEGKTTVSINLALSLARAHSVVLIEADMRKPTVGRSLGLPKEAKGLSELLVGDEPLEVCMQSIEGSDLKVIACGRIPPNPIELLSSKSFKKLLGELQTRFELVIIDSPPLQFVSDALVVGARSNGLVHVVKADVTPAPTVRASLKRVVAARIPIFGVVLNRQNYRNAERYYGEYSGYGKYGYGKPYGEKPGAIA